MNAPSGYMALDVGGARAVVRADVADAVRAMLSGGTLHDVAASHPGARALEGRGLAYAIPLTPSVRIVVRHNRHGGLLAPLTGDRFLAPTRAPRELATALRLAACRVPIPPVVAIVRYRAGFGLERSDVATEEIVPAQDLPSAMTGDPARHGAAAAATGALLRALADAGARHADLNVKNVLLRERDGGFEALVLDVDRVTFHAASPQVARRNWERFTRSARKWRDRRGAPFSEAWLALVAAARA